MLLGMKNALVSAVIAALVSSAGTYAASSTINGHRIASHSIPAYKLTAKAIHSLQGQQGLQGPQGVPGNPGTFNPANVLIYFSDTETIHAGQTATLSAACPLGQVAVGGGAFTSAGIIRASFPYALGVFYPNQWDAIVMNPSTRADMTARVEVSCAAP
jgi:hypothetical protein